MDHADLYWYRAVVKRQYDGDTWYLDIDLGFHNWIHDQAVRLYGLDTPEIRGVERPDGLVALDAVREWCPAGTPVMINTIKDRTGKYGRWLAYIWPEGWDQSVNQRLLDEGLATEYLGR